MSKTPSDANIDTPEIRNRIEIIKQKLWNFDENLDNLISKDELFKFLDSNMKSKSIFDRDLGEKMFSLFDSDSSGNISIDEFIKSYILVEEDLKSHRSQIKAKYQAEKDKMEDLMKKANMYRGEKLNNEGLSPNAQLTVNIFNVDIKDSISQFNNIRIRISVGNDILTTNAIPIQNTMIEINETFNL